MALSKRRCGAKKAKIANFRIDFHSKSLENIEKALKTELASKPQG